MQTYLAILRGINVSGHKPVKMVDLRNVFAELGFENVKTYIQSGNVVFESKETDAIKFKSSIEKAIVQRYGFEVPVLILKKAELVAIASGNPYLTDGRNEDTKFLHVTFLGDEPEKIELDKLADLNYPPDEFYRIGKAMYLFTPGGYGNTKLSNTFFEAKLKVQATTRNWKTAHELLKMMEG